MSHPKYKPFLPALNATEREVLFDLAHTISKKCSELKIVCLMYGGTLLGSYRHHDIIPWDDDLDFFISHSNRGLISRELKKISDRYHVEYAGPRIKFFSDGSKLSTKYPWKWPYVDISFYSENSTHIKDTAKEMSKYVYPKSIIFPTHKRPLGRLMLDAPFDTFATLQASHYTKHCQTYHYSHRLEKIDRSLRHALKCTDLQNVYGFVHRTVGLNNSGIIESLRKGGNEIQKIWIDEPSYAVTKPYTLELL